MKLRLWTRDALRAEEWDQHLEEQEPSWIYPLSWYLDAVCEDWVSICSEDFTFMWPLPLQKRWGVHVFYQPFYCQQLGFFGKNKNNTEWQLEAIKIARSYAMYWDRIHGNTEVFIEESGALKSNSCITHYLSLDAPYKVLRKGYTKGRKSDISIGKAWYTAEESMDIDPLLSMFKESVEHKIKGGVSTSAYITLKKVFNALLEKGKCKLIYSVNQRGEKEAGALFLIHGNRITYIFNASFEFSRRRNGRAFLIDSVIQRYSNSNYILDFETPEVPSIAFFYKSMGGKEHEYQELTFNNLPLLLEIPRRVKAWVKAKKWF